MINIKLELVIVWKILSFLLLIFFIYLFVFNNDSILIFTPTCSSVLLYQKECIFCGMSRAFIEIKNLNFGNALNYNKGSIVLFLSLLLNTFLYILSLKK